MRKLVTRPTSTALLLLWSILALPASPAAGGVCGDADDSGAVSVTDGVLVLRSAAGLPSPAMRDRCDLNFDGSISVTDGVQTLRLAAGLPTEVTCLDAQARDELDRFGTITKIPTIALPMMAVSIADTETPCSGGGETIVTTTVIEDVNCREGNVTTNGVVQLVSDGTRLTARFDEFSATNMVTGETLLSSGAIEFQLEDTETLASGTMMRSSTLLGRFSDQLINVAIDRDLGAILSGTALITVTEGMGSFASISRIQSTFVAPTLTIAVVDFAQAPQEIGIIADDAIGLCRPCFSMVDCVEPLACTPCTTDCSGTVQRCSVNFEDFAARCVDGLF